MLADEILHTTDLTALLLLNRLVYYNDEIAQTKIRPYLCNFY